MMCSAGGLQGHSEGGWPAWHFQRASLSIRRSCLREHKPVINEIRLFSRYQHSASAQKHSVCAVRSNGGNKRTNAVNLLVWKDRS